MVPHLWTSSTEVTNSKGPWKETSWTAKDSKRVAIVPPFSLLKATESSWALGKFEP